MKLITVEATIAASNLDVAMELFSDQAGTVQKMNGCKHYALYRNPSNDGIAIVQQWDTMEAFDAYRASKTFALIGKELRPLMTAPPVTMVAEVDNN